MRGRIFKMATGDGGQPHRWIAPEPVVRAIELLERHVGAPPQKLGTASLWIMTRDRRCCDQACRHPDTVGAFGVRLNGSVPTMIDLPLHQGKPWHLNAHQGRKTSRASSASATGRAFMPSRSILGTSAG